MVSVVNDACVKCKSCVDVCPVDAFHEGETQLVIDPDTCQLRRMHFRMPAGSNHSR